MSPTIECEIRSFIDQQQFDRLMELFNCEGKFGGEESQVTYYFAGEHDLRIQLSDSGSKVWLKSGAMHDDAREEIEVKCSCGDFVSLEKLFAALGFTVEVKWFRKRRRFEWRGVKVTLDDTEGYGRIIELERLVSDNLQDETLSELRRLMAELGVQPTSREEFDQRFKHYKEHWRELVAAQQVI